MPTLDWLDTVTAADIAGWWAYYDAEPWGPERDDMRAEVSRVRALGGDVEHVEPFYPYVKQPEKAEPVAVQAAKLNEIAARMKRERGLQ